MRTILDLIVIMPTFNEEAIIKSVVRNWITELDNLYIQFELHVYDGGSKDSTVDILEQCAKNDPRIVIHEVGLFHGPSLVVGYRDNRDAEWLFQVDSDNEMSPKDFASLWNCREDYDLLIGHRFNRKSPLIRRIVSYISRLTVTVFYGRGAKDVNAPYRLMNNHTFRTLFIQLPDNTSTPNIIISGMACRANLRILEIPVLCCQRTTGAAIGIVKLLKAAIVSFFQTIVLSWRIK